MVDPRSVPAVPPAAIRPNRRLPCSVRQMSAMNDQKTETAKRLNTLTHTKKTRAVHMVSTLSVSSAQKMIRLMMKKR